MFDVFSSLLFLSALCCQ